MLFFCYSDIISKMLFAEFLQKRGLDGIRPETVETGAEKLWGHQREIIENVFKCRVFDFYGSRELPNIASECHMHNGLHVMTDNVFLELLHKGIPAQVEQEGEIIITSLTNFAMPLIRYRNGDLAFASDTLGSDACKGVTRI